MRQIDMARRGIEHQDLGTRKHGLSSGEYRLARRNGKQFEKTGSQGRRQQTGCDVATQILFHA